MHVPKIGPKKHPKEEIKYLDSLMFDQNKTKLIDKFSNLAHSDTVMAPKLYFLSNLVVM